MLREKDLPIQLPGNSYVNASVRFGKEQLIAWLTNVLGTLATSQVLKTSALSELEKWTIVALSGPVFEKAGFYLSALKNARKLYSTTDPSVRNLIVRTAREGTRNTVKDMWVHDPAYLLLMWAWQAINPDTPARMISFISFFLATIVVWIVDVWVDEVKYKRAKNNLLKQWYGIESYYEARMVLMKKYPMQDVLEDFMREFDLESQQTRAYKDVYYVVNGEHLKTYNGRKPSFRLRNRTRIDVPWNTRRSAQLIYTKTNEITPKWSLQWRYYATQKDKFYYPLNYLENLEGLQEIPNQDVRSKLQYNLQLTPPQQVSFVRRWSNDEKKIYVSVDEINQKHPLQQTIEIKGYKDQKELMLEAMKYGIMEYSVQQTTMRKHSEENFGK